MHSHKHHKKNHLQSLNIHADYPELIAVFFTVPWLSFIEEHSWIIISQILCGCHSVSQTFVLVQVIQRIS